MYNYRRVFVDEAKFKHIYGDFYSPFWINGRFFGLEAIAIVSSSVFASLLGLFQIDRLSLGFGLVLLFAVSVYFLDRYLRIDDLPFEHQLMACFKYYHRYGLKKNQLYQDKRLNSANKQYRIL